MCEYFSVFTEYLCMLAFVSSQLSEIPCSVDMIVAHVVSCTPHILLLIYLSFQYLGTACNVVIASFLTNCKGSTVEGCTLGVFIRGTIHT